MKQHILLLKINVTKGYRTSTKQNGKKFVKCPGLIINDGNFVVVDGGCLDGASGLESWIFNYRLLHTWNIHVLEVFNYRIYKKTRFSEKCRSLHAKRLSKGNLHAPIYRPISGTSPEETLDNDQNWKDKHWFSLYARGWTGRSISSVCFRWVESIQCWELCEHGDCFSDSVRMQQLQEEFWATNRQICRIFENRLVIFVLKLCWSW